LSVFGAATAEIVAILVGLTLVLEEPAETSAPVRSEPQARSGEVSNRSERA
jgi:hypothetical protein